MVKMFAKTYKRIYDVLPYQWQKNFTSVISIIDYLTKICDVSFSSVYI